MRTRLAEEHHQAQEVLAWLESLPRDLPDDTNEPPYDGLEVYHAITFLGETRYAPGPAHLNCLENRLCFQAIPSIPCVF